MKKKLFKLTQIIIALLALFVLLILGTNWLVKYKTSTQLYATVDDLPKNKVGLLLGTKKILPNGRINRYYKFRIQTAVKLFKMGKIDYILVSAEHRPEDNYNETKDMYESLLEAGIPKEKIVLDFAGFRTLDSVFRSKDVFGQNTITIISQRFHNERAAFLANSKGIKAVAINARDLGTEGWKMTIREYFARVKMMLDLYVLNKQPRNKVLGDNDQIPDGF